MVRVREEPVAIPDAALEDARAVGNTEAHAQVRGGRRHLPFPGREEPAAAQMFEQPERRVRRAQVRRAQQAQAVGLALDHEGLAAIVGVADLLFDDLLSLFAIGCLVPRLCLRVDFRLGLLQPFRPHKPGCRGRIVARQMAGEARRGPGVWRRRVPEDFAA